MTKPKKKTSADKTTDGEALDDRIDDEGEDLPDVELGTEEELSSKDAVPSTEPEGEEIPSDEEKIPTRSARRSIADPEMGGSGRYLVTALGDVKYDGRYYKPGDVLRLSSDEAAAFGESVEPLGA